MCVIETKSVSFLDILCILCDLIFSDLSSEYLKYGPVSEIM